MIPHSDACRPRHRGNRNWRGQNTFIKRLPVTRTVRCVVAIAAAAACLFPTRLHSSETWRSIDTAHFTVRYMQGMEDLGALTAECAEEAYSRVSDVLSHDMTHVVSIEVWPAHRGPDFIGTGQAGADFRSGPFLKNNYRLSITYPGSIAAFRRLLAHRITHSFQQDILADERVPVPEIRALGMPAWFAEATARYIAGPISGLDSVSGPGMYSLSGFSGYTIFESPREGPGLISFLDSTYGRPCIGEIMRDIRDAGGLTEALTITAGKDYPAFLRDLDGYLSRTEYSKRAEHHDRGDIHIPGGGSPGPRFNVAPALSPDGNSVAYLAAGDGPPVLRIATLIVRPGRAVSATRAVTVKDITSCRGAICPADNKITWTRNGRMVMLAGRQDGDECMLFINTATGALESVLRLPFSAVMNPSLSLNEEYIAFSGSATVSADIYVYNRSAGTMARLTDDAFMDRDPVITPDNASVIYATNRNGSGINIHDSYDIIRQDIRSGVREILVSNGNANIQPAISSDGSQVIYASNEKGYFDLFSLNLKTRKTVRLTDSETGSLYPSFDLSGGLLSYVRNNLMGSDIVIRDMAATGP